MSILIVLLLIVSLILTNLYTFHYVDEINGDARVINYTGIIRGGTQRLIKLELNGIEHDTMILEITNVFREIRFGKGKVNGIYQKNEFYREKIDELNQIWSEIQEEVLLIRNGAPNNRLIQLSEKHYKIANEAVFMAEKHSETKLVKAMNVRRAMLLGSSLMLLIYISQILGMFKLEDKIEELDKKASIDTQTGLPNRSECDKKLESFANRYLPKDLMVMCIDMNKLKETNDRYGHNVGDILIISFAKLLKEVGEEYGFVGRNGGDEFIGVFENCTEDKMKSFLQELDHKIAAFNAQGGIVQISYASGYASSNEDFANVYDLIKKADKRMYENKRAMN